MTSRERFRETLLFGKPDKVPFQPDGVPSDISWSNFVEYSRLLAKLTGWLRNC